MASWLSAGSGCEDGTVVRRSSAAGPTLNINAADLFSPSKLESIFTKDESQNTDSNETFSFIPPSPTKISPTKATEESSELPSDLSQGTSIAVKPRKRQSLGTGDYLSEASRVMTYLRQGQERKRSTLRRHPSASITPSEIYEGPPHRWITPTEPNEADLPEEPLLALHSDEEEVEVKGLIAVTDHETEQPDETQRDVDEEQYQDDTQGSLPESTQDVSISRRPSVIRSPSKSVNWIDSIRGRPPSSVYESDEPGLETQTPPYTRVPSKRVDWADPTPSPGPPSPTCETQLEEHETYPRISTLPNTPVRNHKTNLDDRILSGPKPQLEPLRELSANIFKATKSSKVPQYGIRELSEPVLHRPFTESQLMRLPPRPAAPTPPMSRYGSLMIRQTPQGREFSILSLTPLPDFTVHHQEDEHPERSFIDERAHERALRQAHGTLALARDALIKAITDTQPSEINWDRIRYLRLDKKDLKSLHSLDEFCPKLDQLSVADNQVAHVNNIPVSIRALDISKNMLSDVVSWSGLRNLQYLDVSGNTRLESLDGLGELIHLRTLKANECALNDVQGILQHNGLLELELRGNKLQQVDFANSQLNQLKRLDVSHNQLVKVSNVRMLQKLLDLDVSYNKLHQILPPNRRAPKFLSDLGAGHNKLKAFNFQQFPALKCAYLDGNSIVQVKGLAKAVKLETLSIRHQDVQNNLVNDILCTPNNCRSMALSGNPVPEGLLDLPDLPQHSLLELELAECGIKQLDIGFGCLMPNLRNLNISHNAITDLSNLQGMFRLRRLVAVRNRIRRMRRTCILLARLPSIAELDLRDNPLTMGFHPPPKSAESLPSGHIKANHKWQLTLDDNTAMRRRLTEILLAEHCKNLSLLDGLAFNRTKALEREEVWQKCEERGVVATAADC